MNAIKQQQSAQSNLFSASNDNTHLTQQERRALSLVWRDDESESLKVKRNEPVTDYCAELGYN